MTVLALYCKVNVQSERREVGIRSKVGGGTVPGSVLAALPDDLLQQPDVPGEGVAALPGEGAGREGTVVAEGLGDRQKPGLLERPEVGGEIPVGHRDRGFEVGEREFVGRRENRQDRQAALLVDDPVQLQDGLWIHRAAGVAVTRR